jgi:hypothetical protein
MLYTNEHATYWCKDRYDVLPHAIKNPDANKIIKLIDDSGSVPKSATVDTRKTTSKTPSKKKK